MKDVSISKVKNWGQVRIARIDVEMGYDGVVELDLHSCIVGDLVNQKADNLRSLRRYNDSTLGRGPLSYLVDMIARKYHYLGSLPLHVVKKPQKSTSSVMGQLV